LLSTQPSWIRALDSKFYNLLEKTNFEFAIMLLRYLSCAAGLGKHG
jgi:hypothetical protein